MDTPTLSRGITKFTATFSLSFRFRRSKEPEPATLVPLARGKASLHISQSAVIEEQLF